MCCGFFYRIGYAEPQLRLNDYFSVRVTPGMYFGNRIVRFKDTTNGDEAKQDIKSAYLVLPSRGG